MKNFIFDLKEDSFSKDFVDYINSCENVLIQLFCGDIENLKFFARNLKDIFINAVIIGTSTAGEIKEDRVLENSVVVSISIFEKTTLKVACSTNKNEFERGRELVKKVLDKNTKAIICFSDGLNTNLANFLDGVNDILPQGVIFAGGAAGDNYKFDKTYVVCNGNILSSGSVMVSLNSDVLKAENFYNFGWIGVGIEHTVTKAKGDIVYTIDNKPAIEFYKRYLGKEAIENFPIGSLVFPVIVKRGDKLLARAVIGINKDGSLVLSGDIKEGEKIRIGIGNKEDLIDIDAKFNIDVESFFIYSCAARRKVIPNIIVEEIKPFANIAKTSGFFTYGEFFTNGKVWLFNYTMTVLALSEKEDKEIYIKNRDIKNDELLQNKILVNLVKTISTEYEDVNKLLENKIKIKNENLRSLESLYKQLISIMSEGVLIIDDMFRIRAVNNAFLDMLGEDNIKIFHSIDLYLENFSKYLKEGKKSFETKLFTKNGTKEVLVNVSPIQDIKCKCFLVTISDVSELKKHERELLEQRKLAQMGDMLNMIAHQWRQPLNALSAMAIELDLKASLGDVDIKEIRDRSKKIQKIVQKMSKVIDDFFAITKLNDEKSNFSVSEVIEDALKLIRPQIESYDIHIEIEIKDDVEIFNYKRDIVYILLNFLSNARDVLKDKKENKKIWIRSYIKNGFVYFEVEDNGGGVPEEIKDRIFEPYFTTKLIEGVGLGLYMSKRVAKEILKGDVYFENTKDGVKFILKVPLN